MTQSEQAFSQHSFLVLSVAACAILTSHDNDETAVDGYNPAVFWVVLILCFRISIVNGIPDSLG